MSIPKTKLKKNILDNFGTDRQSQVLDNAIVLAHSNIDNLNSYKDLAIGKEKIINAYNTEYHKRLAYSVACLVLFFLYWRILGVSAYERWVWAANDCGDHYLCNLFLPLYFGKNMAESNKIPPFLGGWLANFVLLPVGLLLLRRATRDKGMFNMDLFLQPITNFLKRFSKNKTLKA
ncbi:MAG: hypothetical protein U5K51_15835 [Flavobacteriaceae bacterium]|nr:hypothetical protein [Flavobacteriaceae bacterium]